MVRKLLLFIVCCGSVTAWAQPIVPPGTMVNAADYTYDLSPGALASIFGDYLATGTEGAQSLPLPTSIAGTSVQATDGVRTVLLPLYMVSERQINVQVPYGMGPELTFHVISPTGMSAPTTISLVPNSPKLFTWDQSGSGMAIVMHHSDGTVASPSRPVMAGEWITIWANGLGDVDPPLPAGAAPNDGSEGHPLHRVTGQVTVRIDGQPAEVNYAGLAPNQAGLYQVNALMPYSDREGEAAIEVTVDGASTQPGLTIPVTPNGFYGLVGAGIFPNGQTKTAASGLDNAIARRHEDRELWGESGFREWTKDLSMSNSHLATSGLALTLKMGSGIVYNNNGIEDGSHGGYYANTIPGRPDSQTPGLTTWICHSTNFRSVNASHFRLAQTTTFDQVIVYFDGNGEAALPFDPANTYNRYRLNMWSNGPGDVPGANSFTGDILSSDSAQGRFSYSPTTVSRVFSSLEQDTIYRLVYTLDQPLTLAAGDYWFASDVAVPETGTGAAIQPSSTRVSPAGPTSLGK